MDSDSWLRLLIFVVFLAGSAYFSCVETAFSCANKIRLKTSAENGDARAKSAVKILNNFDKALSTLLVGNNVMNTALASIATLIATRIWDEGAVLYSTMIVTVVVFLFGETIPKNYAKARSDETALKTVSSLRSLMFLLTPFVFFFSSLAKLATKLCGKPKEPTVTEDELYGIIENIKDDSAIEDEKTELLHSALRFDDRTAQDVFTPRVDMEALDIDTGVAEIVDFIKETHHSRIPVYRETPDEIVGILSVRKYLKAYIKSGANTKLAPLLDKPYFVHKSVSIDDVLRKMSAEKVQLAVVTDDYGGTLGIVSVEDILEELVGEIWDEDDEITFDIRPIGGSKYEAAGSVLVTEVFERLGFSDYDEEDFQHLTMAGWALDTLQQSLCEGAGFDYKTMRVTVTQMQHRRVERLTAELLPAPEKEAQE